MSELQGLQLSLPEFTTRNTEVVAIVVDPVDQNGRVVADLGLGYRILADTNLRVIDAYGLRHDDPGVGHPIARPATVLLDRDGVVRWTDATDNYRYRPHPDVILAAVDRLPQPAGGGTGTP